MLVQQVFLPTESSSQATITGTFLFYETTLVTDVNIALICFLGDPFVCFLLPRSYQHLVFMLSYMKAGPFLSLHPG